MQNSKSEIEESNDGAKAKFTHRRADLIGGKWRLKNSTPKTRAANGRKRTAGMKVGRGTKAKQRARARARMAARVERHGATAPKLRVTKHTIDKFVPGQKRRRAQPSDERFTETILSVFTAERRGGMPPKAEPVSGPRTAPEKHVRDRTSMRAAGMRFVRLPAPDGTLDGRGEWRYVDGRDGEPAKIGHGRVWTRRHARTLARGLDRDVEKLIEIGEEVSRASIGLVDAASPAVQDDELWYGSDGG